jgi:hypothetical protein
MDERAEIWIAKDPDTNAQSKPVSLRKIRKGVRIGRLKTTMMVTRVGSSEWISMERFLREAQVVTPPPPNVELELDADESLGIRVDDRLLTARWFAEPPPDPDDDEPIFVSQSTLDLNFERVMTTKLVKLAYVILIAALAAGVLASLVRVAAAIFSGNGQQIATSIALVPVVVLGCAVTFVFGRMLLEVLLAVFRIVDKLSRIASTS